MQQESKFIIYLTLICFISLLFLPGKSWSSNNNPFPEGGTTPCDTPIESCVAGYSEWHPASGSGSSYSPAGYDYVCTNWKTLDENSCPGDGDGDGEEKEKGWCCNNSTGDCYSCTKTGAWSTLAQCEAHCPSGTYLECRPPLTTFFGADANKEYCKPKTWYIVNPGNECSPQNSVCPASSPSTTYNWKECVSGKCTSKSSQKPPAQGTITCSTDAECQTGTISCPGDSNCYRCNTSYQCVKSSTGKYKSKTSCTNNCKKPSTTPTSPPPTSPPPTSPPPTSPPPTSPPPTSPPPTTPATEPCMIAYFELPARAWVGYPITGRWAASAWCEDCDVDCTPYPECVWKKNNIGIGNIGANEYKFKIKQSGTYTYTLTCYGETSGDQAQKTTTIQAINLPWWREIIPVLTGFLRGVGE